MAIPNLQAMTESLTNLSYSLLDQGVIPDFVVRRAIRHLLRQRLASLESQTKADKEERKWSYIASLKEQKTIALDTDKANKQHYEVPTDFMQSCLGPRMKYSCCLYPTGKESLAQAEELILEQYCERARLQDGMDVLDLGCGWGSLCLFLAAKYPNSRITALSNSSTQKIHIDKTAKDRNLTNLEVVTGDVNVHDFKGSKCFDRILSIEMFEHMKNYEVLLNKVATWLKPNSEAKSGEALLFVHIFCHKDSPYNFESDDGWMAQNFFSGGTMPSFDLFTHFQTSLLLQHSWWLSGKHYAQTCEDWLRLQDKARLIPADAPGQDAGEGKKTFYRFRVFYMACAELFAFGGGEVWGVGHYLFRQRD